MAAAALLRLTVRRDPARQRRAGYHGFRARHPADAPGDAGPAGRAPMLHRGSLISARAHGSLFTNERNR